VYCDYCATTPQSAGEMRLATAGGQWSPDHLLGDLPNLVSGRDTAEPPVSRVLRSIGLGLEDIALAAAVLAAVRPYYHQ